MKKSLQLHLSSLPEPDHCMTVRQLILLGYSLVNIRKALPKLTGITHKEASRLSGFSRQLITLTMNGDRDSRKAQEGLSCIYRVPREILFADVLTESNRQAFEKFSEMYREIEKKLSDETGESPSC